MCLAYIYLSAIQGSVCLTVELLYIRTGSQLRVNDVVIFRISLQVLYHHGGGAGSDTAGFPERALFQRVQHD